MDIVHMKTLIAVIEESGFTAAAHRLGIAKSVCSRRITDLETDLGVQLVNRTTRATTPTDAGRDYYANCVDIIDRINEANANLRNASSRVTGRLRLSVPVSYTETVLGPKLDAFLKSAPDLELHLDLSDRRVDLISGGFDAAIRVGQLEDSTLYARKIGTTSGCCCAAPEYLETHGTPATFDDLIHHTCLRYTNLASGAEWTATRDGQTFRKRVTGNIASNSGSFNRQMAIAGQGIVMLPDFIANPDIATGALVPILEDYEFARSDIHILYPEKRNMNASLRALIDHLTQS